MKYKSNNRPGTGGLLLAGVPHRRPCRHPPAADGESSRNPVRRYLYRCHGLPVTVQSWNRVVSLYGSFAETWTLAGGTLTATTEDAIKERGLDLGTDIAVIGTNQDPNTEEILAQNPDFVILNAEVSEQTALHEFCRRRGAARLFQNQYI